MSKRTKPGQLADEIEHFAAIYPNHIMDRINEIADEEIKNIYNAIRTDAPIGARGQYVRKMRMRTIRESFEEHRAIWYVEKPEHHLTHLLEYGHRTVNGGKTRAIPHIKKHEQEFTSRFYKRAREVIKNEPPRN